MRRPGAVLGSRRKRIPKKISHARFPKDWQVFFPLTESGSFVTWAAFRAFQRPVSAYTLKLFSYTIFLEAGFRSLSAYKVSARSYTGKGS
jgi:hypothetical protein